MQLLKLFETIVSIVFIAVSIAIIVYDSKTRKENSPVSWRSQV